MDYANDWIRVNSNPARAGIEAHKAAHRARRAEVGWVAWWWLYLTDSEFRLAEEGLAIAAEIRAHPTVLRGPVFKAERRRLTQHYHQWAARIELSAECAILKYLDENEFSA